MRRTLCSKAEELLSEVQEELHMTKDDFQARFGDDPRRDDLTLLNPKQDDPTEQVSSSSCFFEANEGCAQACLAKGILACLLGLEDFALVGEMSHRSIHRLGNRAVLQHCV